MAEGKTIAVLGGGVGGVVAAHNLRKKLDPATRIVIVDREQSHIFAPSLLWLLIGRRDRRQISRSLDRLSRKGIDFIRGEVTGFEPDSRRLRIDPVSPEDSEITLEPDFVVVALGADLNPQAVPGLAEAGHNFYSLEGAESLRAALERFTGGKIVVLTATPAYKCPAAPYEAAMLIRDFIEKRIPDRQTQVSVYAAEAGPLGVAGPDVSAGVRQMVEDLGIDYYPDHQVASVDPAARRVAFTNGAEAEFDLLAFVPPHRAPQVVVEAGLTDDSGWVPADPKTMETQHPGVFAIGDVTVIPLAMGKPLPKAGVFAERQAEVVAGRIASVLAGDGRAPEFDGHGECFIETGGGKAGFGRGNFYAQPVPRVRLYPVGRRWHLGKVMFEKGWFRRWF